VNGEELNLDTTERRLSQLMQSRKDKSKLLVEKITRQVIRISIKGIVSRDGRGLHMFSLDIFEVISRSCLLFKIPFSY
jgi:hypothetical protein